MIDLTDSHEVLIQEYEILEREFDQLRVAKARSEERLRKRVAELQQQLRQAVLEIDELQSLLGRAWVRM